MYAPAALEIAAADEIVSSPFTSMEEFKTRLTAICPRVAEFNVPQPQASGLLDLSGFAKDVDAETLVAAFASGYTRAQAGQPVFPFIRSSDVMGRAKPLWN
jgi:hypothetical protein